MSLFVRPIYQADTSFNPLLRFLDEIDSYAQNAHGSHHRRHHVRVFNPRFDVRETADAYELQGELPGIERENISIAFPEPQTIVIRGRVERRSTKGTPPAETVAAAEPATTEAEAEDNDAPVIVSHNATVTDEETEAAKENGESTAAPTPATTEAPTVKAEQKPKDKFWVSERSVGEFSRTFNFSGRIDEDAVSANLTNGVLSITVPKAKKYESRRIAIN